MIRHIIKNYSLKKMFLIKYCILYKFKSYKDKFPLSFIKKSIHFHEHGLNSFISYKFLQYFIEFNYKKIYL